MLCCFPFRSLGFKQRCAPLSLVLTPKQDSDHEAFPAPVNSETTTCPICQSGTVNGIYLVPLSFRDLEKAIDLRKTCVPVSKTSSNQHGKRSRDDDREIHAESSYLLLSHSRGGSLSSSGLSDRELQRTGRWTDEEIAYVDYLVNAFDQGALPLPHGIKLNEFLGDMLLCKSSRLTKKMKNAKLSTRSFKLTSPIQLHDLGKNCVVLSSLQEKFLMSVPSEPTQLELRFNLTKQWRTHFSNLCIQVGYSLLEGTDWIASLEEMERRASSAEELVRKSRRRRMGLALRTDSGASAGHGVFIGGVQAKNPKPNTDEIHLPPVLSMDFRNLNVAMPVNPALQDPSMVRKVSASEDLSNRLIERDTFYDMLEMTSDPSLGQGRRQSFSEHFSEEMRGRPRSFSEDFNAVLNDLVMEPPSDATFGVEPVRVEENCSENGAPSRNSSPCGSQSCGPFLDAIVMYMEHHDLPFQHVDVWVPSFVPRECASTADNEQLRLFQAGHATRGDLDAVNAFAFHEFGVYSEKFSFESDHGLVGRVYASGTHSWESGVHQMDPSYFERTGGAKEYGVKTAVGIPLGTQHVGRVCVTLYSSSELKEDLAMISDLIEELSKYSPEPRWKLVIDLNDVNEGGAKSGESASDNADYYQTIATATNRPSLPAPVSSSSLVSQQGGGTASPLTTGQDFKIDYDEQRIISLLSDHMPISELERSAGESTSSSSQLLPHFMSIRLLLLRPAYRRSVEENDMIDILMKSYRAYSNDNRRSGAELATLLANDWICLKSSFSGSTVPAPVERMKSPQPEIHQSHVFDPVMEPASRSCTPSAPPTPTSPNATSLNDRPIAMGGFNYNTLARNKVPPFVAMLPLNPVRRTSSLSIQEVRSSTPTTPKPLSARPNVMEKRFSLQ
jgi:hypothetical protein